LQALVQTFRYASDSRIFMVASFPEGSIA
jgi:hypothetical protein